MVRWEPGTRERLQTAALDLYVSQGFEQTTVTEIAESVGLTERTFFRHFADKREVLFDGQDRLQQALVEGVATAPADATPLDMVAHALAASADFFPLERRDYSRRRQTVIAGHAALQERELLKLAALGTAMAGALRERGLSEPTATLAAESGVTIFEVAFAQWIAPAEDRSIDELQRNGLDAFRAMTLGDVRATSSRFRATPPAGRARSRRSDAGADATSL